MGLVLLARHYLQRLTQNVRADWSQVPPSLAKVAHLPMAPQAGHGRSGRIELNTQTLALLSDAATPPEVHARLRFPSWDAEPDLAAQLLQHPTPLVAQSSALLLAEQSQPSATTLPLLVALLNHSEDLLRYRARAVLAEQRPASALGRAAIEYLAQQAHTNRDHLVSFTCVQALCAIRHDQADWLVAWAAAAASRPEAARILSNIWRLDDGCWPTFLELLGRGASALQQAQGSTSVPLAEPVEAPLAEPVTAPVAEPVTAPVAEPVTAPLAEPVTAPVAEPVAAPVAEPVAASGVLDQLLESARWLLEDLKPDHPYQPALVTLLHQHARVGRLEALWALGAAQALPDPILADLLAWSATADAPAQLWPCLARLAPRLPAAARACIATKELRGAQSPTTWERLARLVSLSNQSLSKGAGGEGHPSPPHTPAVREAETFKCSSLRHAERSEASLCVTTRDPSLHS